MKLATIEDKGGIRPAALLKDGKFLDIRAIFHAGLASGSEPASVVDMLQNASGTADLSTLVQDLEAGDRRLVGTLGPTLLGEGAIRLLPPIAPSFVLCTGGSYKDHLEEMGAGTPKFPTGFIKSVHAVTGPRDPIVLPPAAPNMVDFECELTCVFARPCYNVAPEEALACVGGYTMVNDVSARDDVAAFFEAVTNREAVAAAEQWTRIIHAKQYPSFCPIGPVVTTADEIADPHTITIRTLLNGKVMQSAHTSDLMFRIADTISHFSRWFAFAPGDVMTTGSPAGVGVARQPPVFLRPGDIVEVQGSGIGSLVNRVVQAR